MDILLQLFLLITGLIVLIKGADWLVDGASSLAKKHKVPDLTIGLTIVAFGTSAPELIVNIFSAFKGHHDLVLGNVIGSNNFNLFIILGLAGIISPLTVQSSTVWKEIPISFLAVVVLFILGNLSVWGNAPILSRADGFILLLFFILFLYYISKNLNHEHNPVDKKATIQSTFKIWLYIILGLTSLVLGGKILVNSAIKIAEFWGVSEKIIGLTIVAAGTSLPELATSVVAALKKNNDIAVGNIIGSNIFNIFLILSVSSLTRPVIYSPKFNTDLYILAGGTLFLFLAMFTGKKKKLDRWEAIILMLSYLAYSYFFILKAV